MPVYIITHGSFFGSPKFRLLMMLLRHAPNVHYLCLSSTLRHAMVQRFGVPATRAHSTGYGVDTDFFRPTECQTGRAVIASAGAANRDYRTLVRAAAGLDAEIKIAADSAWFPTSVDIARDNLPTNVEARSFGDYMGLRALYADARFVVVPLYPAQFACGYAVIAEAMAMGKAVITTRVAARSDFVVDGETGYYVAPGDVQGLRERMVHLLEHPEEARRMGEQARQRMEQCFSVEAYCERIERVMHLPTAQGAERFDSACRAPVGSQRSR